MFLHRLGTEMNLGVLKWVLGGRRGGLEGDHCGCG